jgi:hypothetical protein
MPSRSEPMNFEALKPESERPGFSPITKNENKRIVAKPIAIALAMEIVVQRAVVPFEL